MPTEAAVLDALSGVRDPELDEPITDLKFIADLRVAEDAVDVRLRLPTPLCAPNFAYLMAADAKTALLSVPGVRRARVLGRLHLCRQPDPEAGPLARLALHRDGAAHHSAEAPGDGEAEAGAAVLARRGCFGLGERLKQPAELLVGHADAGVRDGEGDEG